MIVQEQTDTFEDSDTIVRGMATVEIRGTPFLPLCFLLWSLGSMPSQSSPGALDDSGNSGTFVETDFVVDKSSKGTYPKP